MDTKRFIDAAGDGPHVSRTMVYKSHQRFKDGRTDIFDDERKGRPQEVDTSVTESVLRELNNDRRVTVREIADKFDFSVPTIHQIITQNLDFQKVCSRWVPRLLSPDEKQAGFCIQRVFTTMEERR